MSQIVFLVALTFLVCAEASSVNLILQDGASGPHVVDAAVSRITSTCIFGDDKRFLRRLAYVETKDGTDAPEFNDGKNGGIWKINSDMFNALGSSVLNSLKAEVAKEFNVDWDKVTYADLGKPLHSALASSMYIEVLLSSSRNLLDLPRSIVDQSNFWADYYRPGATASDFETRATEFEDSQTSCNVGADIVFILDESGSIGSTDFETEKEFVTKVIENLVIGPDANQAAVITFGSSSNLDIKLNAYQDAEALNQAVLAIRYSGGGTATDLALKQMTDEAFSESNGARPTDKGHPRVGIVLTDGGSNNRDRTQEEAARAREAGIVLFSIGVGRSVNVPELEGMASKPTCLYYSQLNAGFAEILDLVASISATTCGVPISLEPNGTLIKPVEEKVPYNCEIEVPPKGATIQIKTTKGDVTLFLSETTYPSQVYFDAKVSVKNGETASIYIPSDGTDETGIVYCNILSEDNSNVTIITTPGHITYNCEEGRNPCTKENLDKGEYYFEHDSPNKFVQCARIGICYDKDCPAGLVWDKAALVCNWPSSPDPGPVPPPSGYTCAAPNPCSQENTAANGYYFPHVDATKFVQCDAHGYCFEMPCGAGTKWNDDIKTCDHA